MSEPQPTPMLRQYRELKRRHPDALLFFRLGDFYELFEEDARTAARELKLVLTSPALFQDGEPADVRRALPQRHQLRRPSAGARPQGRHRRAAGGRPPRQGPGPPRRGPDHHPRHRRRRRPPARQGPEPVGLRSIEPRSPVRRSESTEIRQSTSSAWPSSTCPPANSPPPRPPAGRRWPTSCSGSSRARSCSRPAWPAMQPGPNGCNRETGVPTAGPPVACA